MMTPVLRQGWVVKQNMMWWWYFVAMLYRNIIKPSKHLQGGILTVTYCTFWIDIINKYYTFAQIGLKIKVFMIVMKWPKSSIEYCMECVDLCIQLSIRQSVARCPPERSGGWAPTISPGAQPILPLTSLQFYVATDFTSEWSRTWCLSKYDVIKLPPPTSTLNDDTVGKEGWGGENVS